MTRDEYRAQKAAKERMRRTEQKHMQAAKDYSDNHTEIPYFVIAGVFLLLLILLIWRIVKIVKS